MALSEKSPYLGGARVRLILWQEPWMWSEDFRGRDRSPSGPPLRGGQSLRWSMSADVALSEKSPYLGGAQVRLILWQEPRM